MLAAAVIFKRSVHIHYFDHNLKARNSTVSDTQQALLSLLERLDDADWRKLVNELQLAIHLVDQRATYIWFAFFPIKLNQALAHSPDPEETAKRLLLKGRYRLADQVDSSAEFMYGHRYWPEVKRAVAEYAETANSTAPPADQIREVARKVAKNVKASESLLVGIAAVAFSSMRQVGLQLFKQPAAT